MSHLYRPAEDLMKIAAAGGGFTTDGGPRSVENLMRIAAAGSAKAWRLRLAVVRPTDTRIRPFWFPD
jgi:hypothetical protein